MSGQSQAMQLTGEKMVRNNRRREPGEGPYGYEDPDSLGKTAKMSQGQ